MLISAVSLLSIYYVEPASALTMKNDTYMLELQLESEQKPTPTITEPAKVLGEETKRSDFFTFSISPELVDFGPLDPTNPVLRKSTLRITSADANGYAIYASENHSPAAVTGTSIPNTSCDDGNCSQTIASLWTNVLTYGFGYRCESKEPNRCVSGFENADTFMRFSDESLKESPSLVLFSRGRKGDEQASITYKMTVAQNQEKALYQNVVTYIAIPAF